MQSPCDAHRRVCVRACVCVCVCGAQVAVEVLGGLALVCGWLAVCSQHPTCSFLNMPLQSAVSGKTHVSAPRTPRASRMCIVHACRVPKRPWEAHSHLRPSNSMPLCMWWCSCTTHVQCSMPHTRMHTCIQSRPFVKPCVVRLYTHICAYAYRTRISAPTQLDTMPCGIRYDLEL